ncbi:alpha/beta fold hydrolase [Tsukamurella sp. PLM1]|uniref:alpha/beta fold hydrolase n=1 Tax=Tsukamurella sp. PLM1 TaxID=2929795 RepID=UPI0020497FB4|nr:alpha/beta hydrolase [Tsukamurella sp. PLM1]BDH58628.1 esterase [Tsukamurella sp. PLM1]
MDVILIPGLWLDASSWDEVLPPLVAAGHRTIVVESPGLGAPSNGGTGPGIADWVGAVVAAIDGAEGPVVLVGHSGGANAAWGAADARPDLVARVVIVDAVPPHDGAPVNAFDVIDGVVPFPGWDFFDDEDVFDLDAATRARTARLARSVPAGVPHDPVALRDARRFDIPVTLLMAGLDGAGVDAALADSPEHAAEYGAIVDREVTRIGSGHWPQFAVPQRLGELIAAAIR